MAPSSALSSDEHAAGLSQPGGASARGAGVPGSQGTNSVRGTWGSEGEAGRHLRSTTEEAGTSSPESNGTLRPLGLPALEDKIVSKAAAQLLESIYEQDYCEFSYGFRPGRTVARWWQARRETVAGHYSPNRNTVLSRNPPTHNRFDRRPKALPSKDCRGSFEPSPTPRSIGFAGG